ncbi:MAG: PrsW family intramembrane metalloprotease, partial [Calditrichales bacterium]
MLPLKISIALFPVLIFLFTLMMFDSFKLIRLKTVLRTIVGGGIVALVCFALNRWLISYYQIEFVTYSRYMAPVIEELIKAALIIVLIRSSNIGFMVDAAILGFAVGAGFAIIENIYHLQARTDLNLFIWILRGLGTAVMHGATTAIFAVISKYVVDRYTSLNLIFFVPGLLVA